MMLDFKVSTAITGPKKQSTEERRFLGAEFMALLCPFSVQLPCQHDRADQKTTAQNSGDYVCVANVPKPQIRETNKQKQDALDLVGNLAIKVVSHHLTL